MRIIDCLQGSDAWFEAKRGKPSSSRFSDIITSTGNPSKSADKYMDELVAELLAGKSLSDGYSSRAMDLGREREPEARELYSFVSGNEVEEVGFCVSDCDRFGCSPDGLIGGLEYGAGGLEIKCPKPTTMVSYYRNGFPAKYKGQVQGCLLVSDRKWWDFFAYHPDMMPYRERIYRDEVYITKLQKALEEFCERLEEAKEELKGWRV